jgi:hypothetical protein
MGHEKMKETRLRPETHKKERKKEKKKEPKKNTKRQAIEAKKNNEGLHGSHHSMEFLET